MSGKPQHYQIRIEGHVNFAWTAWFDAVEMQHTDDGETLVEGWLPDQTALHGVLMKIRDLGLTLIEVKRREPDPDASVAIEKTRRELNV